MVEHILNAKAGAAVAGSVVGGVGYIVPTVLAATSSITSEAVLPIFGLAAGVATGVVWLWRSPQDATLKSEREAHAIQLTYERTMAQQQLKAVREHLEERLRDEEEAHEKTRERLRKALEYVPANDLKREVTKKELATEPAKDESGPAVPP